MNVDIEIIKKPEVQTKATFNLKNLNGPKDFKETLAIIFMISADYYLDPELEIADLENFKIQGLEKSKSKLEFLVSEEGLELEFTE